MNTKPVSLAIASLMTLCSSVTLGDVYQQVWSVSGWLDRRDFATEMAIDPQGGIYLGGRTGEVYGTPAVGPKGGLAAKYNSEGERQWLSHAYDGRGLDHVQGLGVAADGSVYISGETYRYPAGAEAFLVKFDAEGQRVWERHLGSPNNEFGKELAIDSQGSVYVTGSTTGLVGETDYPGYDAFLSKHSAAGVPLWTKQFDSDVGNQGSSLAADSEDNLYLAATGSVGGASLSRLDVDGVVAWTEYPNYSTKSGRTTSISKVGVDGDGDVYTTGTTNQLFDSALGLLEGDAYVAKHSSSGEIEWRLILESETADSIGSIAFGPEGSIYVSGSTSINPGGSVRGLADAFWGKITPDGTLVTTEVFGTEHNDYATGIAVDGEGRVFVGGATSWNVNNYFAGEQDAFLTRFDPIPEPTALLLLLPLSFAASRGRSMSCS